MTGSTSHLTVTLLAAFAAGGIVSAHAASPAAAHVSHPLASVRQAVQPHRIPRERKQERLTTAQALPLHLREHPGAAEGHIETTQRDDHVIRIAPTAP